MAWVEREEPWYGTDVQYCDVTGQLLPRRYWEFEHDGRVIRARDARCEALFREYVLTRGTEAPAKTLSDRQMGAGGGSGADW
jgi:hypothetical protein